MVSWGRFWKIWTTALTLTKSSRFEAVHHLVGDVVHILASTWPVRSAEEQREVRFAGFLCANFLGANQETGVNSHLARLEFVHIGGFHWRMGGMGGNGFGGAIPAARVWNGLAEAVGHFLHRGKGAVGAGDRNQAKQFFRVSGCARATFLSWWWSAASTGPRLASGCPCRARRRCRCSRL